MELHYSVNGEQEKTRFAAAQTRREDGQRRDAPSALEDYKMSPGDVVGDVRDGARCANHVADRHHVHRSAAVREELHAVAADGRRRRRRAAIRKRIAISQRQKEIIAATWNEIRGGGKDKVNSAENAKFLAEVQNKLKEQAKSLADRATQP